MIVYGDHAREVSPGAELEALHDRLAQWNHSAGRVPPMQRHGELVELLVDAGALAQGLLDAAFERRGRIDDVDAADARALAFVTVLAGAVVQSWDAGMRPAPEVSAAALDALLQHPLPERVRLKVPEGFAFYALYPEAYAAAARLLPSRDVQCVGIRSIGLTLGAVVQAALGGQRSLCTVRPQGHPFSRSLKIGEGLEAAVCGDAPAHYAIVDEGPGLSGSSFACVSRWLIDRGVSVERIHFLPSHGGFPGAATSKETRGVWEQHARHVVPFEKVFLDPLSLWERAGVREHATDSRGAGRPQAPLLGRWAEDLTGAPASVEDLSGGAWRALLFPDGDSLPPVHLQLERRKFLLRGPRGAVRLKFVGLGRSGAEAHERARRLADEGFAPPVIARRHGFLVEPWLDGATPLTRASVSREVLLDRVASYLAFRARSLPAPPEGGATITALHEMARFNIGRALGDEVARQLLAFGDRLEDLQRRVQPVATDNRMHPWEWLVTQDGRLLKTDGADHCLAHDLIGSQDLAWDVVGASVELNLPVQALSRELERRGVPSPDAELLMFYGRCYAAFQLGYWTLAAETAVGFAPAEAERCRIHAARYASLLLNRAREPERVRG